MLKSPQPNRPRAYASITSSRAPQKPASTSIPWPPRQSRSSRVIPAQITRSTASFMSSLHGSPQTTCSAWSVISPSLISKTRYLRATSNTGETRPRQMGTAIRIGPWQSNDPASFEEGARGGQLRRDRHCVLRHGKLQAADWPVADCITRHGRRSQFAPAADYRSSSDTVMPNALTLRNIVLR